MAWTLIAAPEASSFCEARFAFANAATAVCFPSIAVCASRSNASIKGPSHRREAVQQNQTERMVATLARDATVDLILQLFCNTMKIHEGGQETPLDTRRAAVNEAVSHCSAAPEGPWSPSNSLPSLQVDERE